MVFTKLTFTLKLLVTSAEFGSRYT